MPIYIIATLVSMLFASFAAASTRSAQQLQPDGNFQLAKRVARGRFWFAICSAMPLILLAALRHELGTDWPIYSSHFISINQGGEAFSEFGFNLLNRLVYTIFPDFALMVAVTSVIIYSFVFKAIYDQSVNYAFSILVFVLNTQYFNSMNQLRQMMTVAIFLYAIKFIKQRKLVVYIVWMLLAATIHTSALLLIPLYFLYGFRIRPLLHFVCIALGAVLMVPMGMLLRFVATQTRYSWYFDSIYTDTTGFYVAGFLVSVVLLALFDFYYCYGENKNDTDYNFFVNLYWIATLMTYLTTSIPQGSRLLLAFVAPTIFTIPLMLLRERLLHRRLVLMFLVILLLSVKLVYDVYVNGWFDVIPYQSIFTR